jgi:hypothetical protein
MEIQALADALVADGYGSVLAEFLPYLRGLPRSIGGGESPITKRKIGRIDYYLTYTSNNDFYGAGIAKLRSRAGATFYGERKIALTFQRGCHVKLTGINMYFRDRWRDQWKFDRHLSWREWLKVSRLLAQDCADEKNAA